MGGSRIVIPLLYDYYIFAYLRPVIRALAVHGCDVTVVVFHGADAARYTGLPCVVEHAPLLLRACNARSNRIAFRIILWIGAWTWARVLRRRFDAAVLPGDMRPVWYAIGRTMPAVMCHTSTNFYDYEGTIAFERWQPERRSLWQQRAHRILLTVDRFSGGRILPRAGGVVTRYRSPSLILIDRLMGFRAAGYLGDFSSPMQRTVTGNQMKDVLVRFGADPTAVHVVGHPGFDHLFAFRETFGPEERRQFRVAAGIPIGRRTFCFFLSPSSFTAVQLREVIMVIERIFMHDARAHMILKFHPKTVPSSIAAFRTQLHAHGDAITFITAFRGDEHNARLMLASDVLVQKQCSLGLLAMMYERPMISYNIEETEYEDNMYKVLDASLHAESAQELDAALVQLDDPGVMRVLHTRQRSACERFCLATDTASERVAACIVEHVALRG